MTAALLTGCSSEDSGGGGHLYVANSTSESHRVALSVDRTSNGGESIVDGVYRIPPATALQFEGVLESGERYELRARQPDVPEAGIATLGVDVETCEQGDQSRQMAIRILAGNNGPDIVTYGCDEAFDRNDEFEYVDPSEYRIGTATETISTATPS